MYHQSASAESIKGDVKMYRKMLVPLDGSEIAETVLPYAKEFAGRLGLEVVLLHVYGQAEDESIPMHRGYIERTVEIFKRQSEEVQQRVDNKSKTVKMHGELVAGQPAEEILRYADENNVDLILMATRGRSGIKRWILGNVSDRVVRAAKQPVILIRATGTPPDVRGEEILKKVIVTLDGSLESESVIPHVKQLLPKLSTDVILLHIAQPYHVYATGEVAARIPYTEEEMKQVKANAESYLKKVVSRLKGKSITIKTEVRVGAAADEIIKFADETTGSIVAMTTHGRSGITRWAFGSISGRVLQGGNNAIMLVRIPEPST
jgi:nucleotide-binding universal stress UspA family protein